MSKIAHLGEIGLGVTIPLMLQASEPEPVQPNPEVKSEGSEEIERDALLALLRLLIREPPRDHDFHTCPICQRHGITKI